MESVLVVKEWPCSLSSKGSWRAHGGLKVVWLTSLSVFRGFEKCIQPYPLLGPFEGASGVWGTSPVIMDH